MQLWGIRILTKDNLKNTLVNKNFKARVPQMFSAPGFTAPKMTTSVTFYFVFRNDST